MSGYDDHPAVKAIARLPHNKTGIIPVPGDDLTAIVGAALIGALKDVLPSWRTLTFSVDVGVGKKVKVEIPEALTAQQADMVRENLDWILADAVARGAAHEREAAAVNKAARPPVVLDKDKVLAIIAKYPDPEDMLMALEYGEPAP